MLMGNDDTKLRNYVRKYFAVHPEVKLIVVAGSVGKTSTKNAIAAVLAKQFSVRMHEDDKGAYSSVPLSILGLKPPKNPKSFIERRAIYKAAKARIKNPPDTEIIIQELDAVKPGDMADFGQYLRPHVAVVTSVSPEHMSAFQSIDAVAQEQLSVGDYSETVLINRYDIPGEFAKYENNPRLMTYGSSELAEVSLDTVDIAEDGKITADLLAPTIENPMRVVTQMVGEHKLRDLAAAAAVGFQFGMIPSLLVSALESVEPAPGRLNPLPGIDGTIILDDTESSSPASTVAALQALYQFKERPQLIALFGSMNELGALSQEQHEMIGKLCNPNQLSWVVTVGQDANQYLAPAARRQGNQVKSCANAIEAAEFVRSVTETGAVILVNGSRDNIFLEEAVKILCDIGSYDKLVRQSNEWLDYKRKFFEWNQQNNEKKGTA